MVQKPSIWTPIFLSAIFGVWRVIKGEPYEALFLAIFAWVVWALIIFVHWKNVKIKSQKATPKNT
jgi:hypothetical protein